MGNRTGIIKKIGAPLATMMMLLAPILLIGQIGEPDPMEDLEYQLINKVLSKHENVRLFLYAYNEADWRLYFNNSSLEEIKGNWLLGGTIMPDKVQTILTPGIRKEIRHMIFTHAWQGPIRWDQTRLSKNVQLVQSRQYWAKRDRNIHRLSRPVLLKDLGIVKIRSNTKDVVAIYRLESGRWQLLYQFGTVVISCL